MDKRLNSAIFSIRIGMNRITDRTGREWYNDGRFIRSTELKI